MPSMRRVTATVNFTGQDWERFGSNEYPPPFNTSQTIVLSDNLPQNIINFQQRWGGECRAEFLLLAQRLGGGEVKINGTLKLFEGTSEDTGDLDGVRNFEFVVPRSATLPFECLVKNDDEGDDDWAKVAILVSNQRQVSDDD